MNGYLIPANAKKGTLIFNVFRRIDLLIFGTGIAISLILLIILKNANIVFIAIAVMPVSITGLLVVPVPNYHNVLCALQSIYRFYTGRRKYIWRGWCFHEQYTRDEQSKNKQ